MCAILTFSHAVQSQCLLTCKAIGKDGEMIVRGPLEVLDGTHCTTVTGQDGLCVDAMCAVRQRICTSHVYISDLGLIDHL